MHHAAGIVINTVTGEKLLVAIGGSSQETSAEKKYRDSDRKRLG